MKKKQEKNT